MKAVVIDGQGGGIGKSIIEELKKEIPDLFIIAAGTNAIATSNMLRSGANVGATGENAIIYNATHVDMIIGPIGIAFANSMYGEISKEMALAISSSEAKKYLIPISKLNAYIPGIQELPISDYIQLIVKQIAQDMIDL